MILNLKGYPPFYRFISRGAKYGKIVVAIIKMIIGANKSFKISCKDPILLAVPDIHKYWTKHQ